MVVRGVSLVQLTGGKPVQIRPLTILVNSCDNFEDCWHPFFKLLSIYWPDCAHRIILNTEHKTFAYRGLSIRSSQVATAWSGSGRIPWSDCLLRCLEQVETEYVLYLQEDYFLNAPVDQGLLLEFIALMSEKRIPHIRLMELDRNAGHRPSPVHPLLWEIHERADYRLNLQAGLWHKDTLCSYLRPGESAWQFERWGTRRSYQRGDAFLCQSLDHFNARRRFIVPYHPTGIVRGKWYEPAVKDLFIIHGIEMDFSKRGLHRPGVVRRWLVPWRARLRRLFMTGVWLQSRFSGKTRATSL